MFEVDKSFHFEAGHVLDHHDGKCRHPHGHSYVLKVTIRSAELEKSGPKKNMVMDFSTITEVVKPMIDHYFDHKWLNDTLESDSPSAEFMAKWIFDFLESKLIGLYSITIFETKTCSATYIRPLA
ncbi:MAG: 6-carboxytetrahydropterin synthase QueD [Parachlamydiaceae bacterium]|nr:6-carboxytetrahydropterin synthase QueD [Parachlamydiaceae bacterium]